MLRPKAKSNNTSQTICIHSIFNLQKNTCYLFNILKGFLFVALQIKKPFFLHSKNFSYNIIAINISLLIAFFLIKSNIFGGIFLWQ